MIRLFAYLMSVLRLLLLGRWRSPGYVRDVSASDFNTLTEAVVDIEQRLATTERQAEATRKKVYREDVKGDGAKEAEVAINQITSAPTSRQQALSQLQSGDEVPVGLL